MKKLVLVLLIVFAFALLSAQLSEWKWAVQAGAAGDDRGNSLTRDASGNLYVAGSFEYSVTFGATTLTSHGSSDFFLAKMDPLGNWLWAISAGGDSLDYATGVEVDAAGNIYVSGGFGSTASFGPFNYTASGYTDPFVAKLDSQGNWLWVKRASSSYAAYGFVSLDPQGNVWFSGIYSGITQFGTINLIASVYDIFVCKLDNDGNWLWVRRVNGPGHDQAGNCIFDAAGNAYICGDFMNSLNFGNLNIQAQGSQQSFVAKVDPDGVWQWAVSYDSVSYQSGHDLVLDHNGDLRICGELWGTCSFGNTTLTSYGSSDLFIARLSTDGTWLDAIQVGSPAQETTSALTAAADGLYFSGYFYTQLSFGPFTLSPAAANSYFIAKLSNTGDWLWANAWSGTGYSRVFDSCADNVGNAYLTGCFTGTQTLGSFTLTTGTTENILLAKIGSPSYPVVTVAGQVVGNVPPLAGLPGVAISLSGPANYSVTTSTDGSFTFSGVNSHEVYILSCNAPGFDPLSLVVEVNTDYIGLGTLVLYETCYPPASVSAAIEGMNAAVSWTVPRDLAGYQLWRLSAGDEQNENAWTLLTPNPISGLSFLDTGWDPLPYGNYRWAVKAVYFGGRLSPPAFSNVILNHAHLGTVAGTVVDAQNEAIPQVSLRSGEFFSQSGLDGSFSLMLPEGAHLLRFSHPCFAAQTMEVQITTAQTTVTDLQLSASNLLLSEDFEAYPEFSLSCLPWILNDVDQDPSQLLPGYDYPNGTLPSAFMIFAPAGTIPPLTTFEAHSGTKFAASLAGQMLGNNDWLISPLKSGGGTLSFWARSFSAAGGLEMFRVGVSAGGTEPGDFTFISGAQVIQAPQQWTEFSYSLADWQDQDIRIGINCVSYRNRMFCLDDISVTASDAAADPVLTPAISALETTPNPFRDEARISFRLSRSAHCQLSVYNVRGQLVSQLVNGLLPAGTSTLIWTGMDSRGRKVSPGIYLFRLQSGQITLNSR
ncbi:MAG: choice-of-anchor J domain-containing protein, partial [Candidatus Syntrophosphaera sp.]|nr:choice-of-anchor J domain-containing protein [Candidatus Syntrophosphaera sp.]